MADDYPSLRTQAESHLAAGDARAAFGAFRWAFEYPGRVPPDAWAEALSLFARIAAPIAGDAFADHARRAAADPDDVAALFDLGYHLIEQQLHGIAATVLARARSLAPGEPTIVAELACALERQGLNREAVRVLSEDAALLEGHAVLGYLMAFNGLMTGDLATPRRLLDRLRRDADEDLRSALPSLEEMLTRAEHLRPMTLGDRDLRAWELAVNGSLLLYLSPHGFDDGMNGRHAFLQESPSLCREGIRRVRAVLDHLGLRPPAVFTLPERNSEPLGLATARLLGIPATPWPAGGTDAPGLVVAYDLSLLDGDVLQSLYHHRPNQILWAHAVRWTEEIPFAPDLLTHLVQYDVPPWDPQIRAGPDGQGSGKSPPIEGTPRELAETILAAPDEDEGFDDLPALRDLATRAMALPAEAPANLTRTAGPRARHRTDSPVKSSRFL